MAEQRQEPRLQEVIDVTIVVKAAPEARELEGKVFSSQSIDISSNGLQLDSDTPFPVGTQLELNIIFNRSPASYWQTGYVVWDIKPMPDYPGDKNLHRIGIQFCTTEDSQLHAWRSLVSDLFERHMMRRPQ